MLTSIQSADIAPEVNLRITQARKHTKKGSTLALKPRVDVTRSPKQGYQWPHERDLCPPKILFRQKNVCMICVISPLVFMVFLNAVWCDGLVALINLTSQLIDVLSTFFNYISSIQVRGQVYLNTPPNFPRPVRPVAVALNPNQGGAAANAMSPWLQQYLTQGTRPTMGTSPELTRQTNVRQQQAVTATRAPTTTSAAAATTVLTGLVSILERLPNTGRTVAAQGSNALGRNNPFAINSQIGRGTGDSENNPIVVSSPTQQNGARNQRATANNQQATATRAPQRTTRDDNRSRGGGNLSGQSGRHGSNVHRQQHAAAGQGQNYRQQPNRYDHTQQSLAERQSRQQQTHAHNSRQQQRRPQSRNQGRVQTENRYTSQYGNPPIWIE